MFRARDFEIIDERLSVPEGAGATSISVTLAAPAYRDLSASYHVEGLEAQADCQNPDFTLASGRITWLAGETTAVIQLYIGDDDLAETDERFRITFDDETRASSPTPKSVVVVIRDDDNTGIVDARSEFGVEPGRADDQAPALQAAFDHAAALGRGVVVVAPGDYQISHVSLKVGTSLFAADAHWHRPPLSPADVVTISLTYAGASDSPATLIEGLSIDGHRDLQGAYENSELVDTQFVRIAGSADNPGRARASVERLTAINGTASAVYIGPNADVDVCRLSASNMWRDALTLRGGGSSVRVRGLDAAASDGTTGIWLGGNEPGLQGTRRIEADIEDARLGTGDVEVEAFDNSRVTLRRLSMTQAPLRLVAPASSVRISESVLVSGVPSAVHNFWDSPDDVEVSDTTLIASESGAGSVVLPEQDRQLATASVRWSTSSATAAPPHLLFNHCQFERAADTEDTDVVYAVDSPAAGGSVEIRASTLGRGISGWFAPSCQNCSVGP